MVGLDGGVLHVNAALCSLLGEASPEDAHRNNLSFYCRDDDRERLFTEILPHALNRGCWIGDLSLQSTQGRSTPGIHHIFLVRDDNGAPLCFTDVVTDPSKPADRPQNPSDFSNRADLTPEERVEWQSPEEMARLVSILDNTSDLVALALPDGKILYINESGSKMVGWQEFSPEEISHRALTEVHPDWALRIVLEEGIPAAMKSGVWRGETALVGPDGREVPTSQVIMAHRRGDGKVGYLSTILRDISEFKRIEQELRESEEKFRSIVSNMQEAFFRCDLEGKIIYTTSSAAHLLGCASPEEMIGRSVEEFHYYPGESEKQFRILQVEGKLTQYEMTLKRRDDATPVIVSANVQFFRDADGTIVGIEGVYRDVTERKRVEKALSENLSLLAEAERIGHTGSWKANLDMSGITMSAEIRRIWGFPEQGEVQLDAFSSRIHPDDRQRVIQARRESLENKTPSAMEYRIVLPDGTIRYLAATSEVMLDERGDPVGFHGSVHDITERKLLEDEIIKTQKLDSIGTLAGGLAHDYNNLLSVIIGNLEMAKMDLSPVQSAYASLAKAEAAVLAARDLTRQLVNFARGSYPVSKVMPIVYLVIECVNLALSGSDLEPHWTIEEDLPPVKIDENQIRQVIHNIVINALEAMPPAEGKLFVEVDRAFLTHPNGEGAGRRKYVRLVFRDTGRGICKEHLSKVFDPYFTTKDMSNIKGMGLGLAIAYSIIKRHGGDIALTSREGEGTTVTLYLPAAEEQEGIDDGVAP